MSADTAGYAVLVMNGVTSYRAVSSISEVLAGETFSSDPPIPTLSDAVISLTADVQAWLDAIAQANGYDSLASCISYLGSSITQWSDDAAAALAWRDAVWQACFQWQQSAEANPPATFPTSQEVIAQLPQPAKFGWVMHQPGASS